MAKKRFDASVKTLLETYPADWLKYLLLELGLAPTTKVRVLDADVSTVSAAVDKVLRVGGKRPWLLHLEVQTSHDALLPMRLLLYNVLLRERHRLPVRTVLLLLRPEADRGSLHGVVELHQPEQFRYLEFRYDVIRLWQQPVDTLLDSGLGLLPLAQVAPERVTEVVDRMEQRFAAEAPESREDELWAATFVLLGLHFSTVFADELIRRARHMKESVTYQMIVAEGVLKGKIETLQETVLSQGAVRFGNADDASRTQILALSDVPTLKQLTTRLLEVNSWAELLPVKPRSRRKK